MRVARLQGATSIATNGFGFGCATRTDGSVRCWGVPCAPRGDGSTWCLGDAGVTRARPLRVSALQDVVQVVATSTSGLFARLRDGRVICGRDE